MAENRLAAGATCHTAPIGSTMAQERQQSLDPAWVYRPTTKIHDPDYATH
jgi:hypothetical protein